MKTFLTLFVLLFSSSVVAEGINQLNDKLLEIEETFDICLETKDKDLCEKVLIKNQLLLEIYGNETFAKLIESKKCSVGTKCGATIARITAKSIQLLNLVFEFIENDLLD